MLRPIDKLNAKFYIGVALLGARAPRLHTVGGVAPNWERGRLARIPSAA
ncbi:MAG: hypothetical protein IJ586_02065 [Alloprevotella sp.]|nr:hypothetical protein [Alloprevotella sp.]